MLIFFLHVVALWGVVIAASCRNSSRVEAWSEKLCLQVLKETNYAIPESCYDSGSDKKRLSKTPADDYRTTNLLVTGIARSGTTFTSKISELLKFPLSDDNHQPTEFGMVAWKLATHVSPHDFHAGGAKYRFKNVIQVVRDPLHTIRSLRTEFGYWKWNVGKHLARRIVPKVAMNDFNLQSNNELKESDYVLFGMRLFVEWNGLIERTPLATTVRVEAICEPESLSLFFEYADCANIEKRKADMSSLVSACQAHEKELGGWNSRQVKGNEAKCAVKGSHCYSSDTELTWLKLASIDVAYARRAYEMARAYGYSYNASLIPQEWQK